MQGLVPGVTCPMIPVPLLGGVVDAKVIDINATWRMAFHFQQVLKRFKA